MTTGRGHTYYNEIDPQAAAWLRELMRAGELPDGTVDERSVWDVVPADLRGFRACHFFAGIGGWAYALRLAHWPDDREVWTGSCPCQPFSAAGQGRGFADERHLWPAWFHLIRECRPGVVFGEQVDKATAWLDLVHTDLEAEGYAVGAVDLPAGSVGAPHRRQRLWFVAEAEGQRSSAGESRGRRRSNGTPHLPPTAGNLTVALADESQSRDRGLQRSGRLVQPAEDAAAGRAVADDDDDDRRQEQRGAGLRRADVYDADGCGEVGVALGDTDFSRSQGRGVLPERAGERAAGATGVGGRLALALGGAGREERPNGGERGSGSGAQGLDERSGRGRAQHFWSPCDWLPCRDGKFRPVEPGTFPLAHGVSARVGRLRGYGNAITPPLAAAFIRAAAEAGVGQPR